MKAGLLAVMFAAACLAQDGVVSGYVFDASKGGFRAVLGMAGAAQLGETRIFEGGIAAAEVRDSTAVFISNEAPARVYTMHLDSSEAPLPRATSLQHATRVFLNRDGSASLLYSATEGLLQFGDSTPLPESLLDGPLQAAALSADGKCALIATSTATHLLCDGGKITTLLREESATPTAIGWTQDGRGALISVRGENRLLWIEDVAAHTSAITFPLDGAPTAVTALDATTAGVALDDGSLLIVDLHTLTEPPHRIALPARATGLAPLLSPSLLTGTRAGEGPLLLLDGARGWTPFFVPLD